MISSLLDRLTAILNYLSASVDINQNQPKPEGVNDSNRAEFCDCVYFAVLNPREGNILDCAEKFGPLRPNSFEKNCPLYDHFVELHFCRQVCKDKNPPDKMKCVLKCLDRFEKLRGSRRNFYEN